jgi:hypothetical protein
MATKSRFSLFGWLFFALIFLGILGFIFIVSQRGGVVTGDVGASGPDMPEQLEVNESEVNDARGDVDTDGPITDPMDLE